MRNFFLGCLVAFSFGAITDVYAQEDISKHPSCPYCGMDRAKFSHSRVYIEYEDDSTVGTCSVHCAAIDMTVKFDRTPSTIWVGDYDTRTLIDAEKAFWVVGGKKMGVMSKRAKWAFNNKKSAEHFTDVYGGELASFEEAIVAAYADMYKDNKMIREKRKKMQMKKTKNDD